LTRARISRLLNLYRHDIRVSKIPYLMLVEQTDRGRLDYATDSISAYTSIDDGEQRYETEEGTIHK